MLPKSSLSVLIFLNFAVFPSLQFEWEILHKNRVEKIAKLNENIIHLNGFRKMLPAIEPIVSSSCYGAFSDLFAPENKLPAMKFFDAWGKLPSGLLFGRSYDFGSYEECQRSELFSKNLRMIVKGTYTLMHAWIGNDSGDSTNFNLLFGFGICVPHTCTQSETYQIFTNIFPSVKKLTEIFVNKIDGTTGDEFLVQYSKPLVANEIKLSESAAAVMGIIVFSFVGFLVALSSFYEVMALKHNGEINELLASFSILTNARQLFDIQSNQTSNLIGSLNGIRVLTLFWNIYGHSHMWSQMKSEANSEDRVGWMKNLYSRILHSANLSVDSFFVLSGLLVAWIGFRRMKRTNGKISIHLMYLHRYLRFAPSMAVLVIFSMGLVRYMGEGPFWYSHIQYTISECEKNWWVTLLCLSNYVNQEEMCLPFSWFLSTDFQLYALSPLFLFGLWKWKRKMNWLLYFLILFSMLGIFNAILEIGINVFAFDGLMDGISKFNNVQLTTHGRMGPWLIGFLFGYYLFELENRVYNISKFVIRIAWTLTLLVVGLMVFGPQHFIANDKEASLFEVALYESMGRYIWSLALGWVIFSCHMGYSKTLNAFLSHPVWQPIAKLNFAIFVVKTFVNIRDTYGQKITTHFSDYEMVSLFWSDFGISFSWAIVLAVCVELPFKNIDKYLLKRVEINYKLTRCV